PVGADAGDDQGEARDNEGGDVHELIISSARPNARCTAHCRRPAKFADHGGSARASVRRTEPSSATCEATPATNMNPEKLWPRESGPEGPNSHRGVRLRSYQCRLLGRSSATSGSAGTPRPSPGPPRPARAHARPRGSGPQAPFPDWLSAKADPTGQAGRLGPHALAALSLPASRARVRPQALLRGSKLASQYGFGHPSALAPSRSSKCHGSLSKIWHRS